MRSGWLALAGAALLLGLPARGETFTINGEADDVMYGPALVIQDTATGFGDNSNRRPDWANGSELDAAYGVIHGGVLYLVLAGNLESNGNHLDVFFDTRPGGQNQLLGVENPDVDGGGLRRMGYLDATRPGLKFASGFEADFFVSVNVFGAGPTRIYVDYAELYDPTNAPTPVGYYCGEGLTRCETSGGALAGGGPGAPAILCTVDNSNIDGVEGGPGLSAYTGAGVTTGVELAIPLAALGNPAGPIAIAAFVNGTTHEFVSNQWLGGFFGVPPNPDPNGNPGEPRTLDVSFTLHAPFVVAPAGEPTGACCLGETCVVTTAGGCGGVYLGDNTSCAGNPCDAVPAGACCVVGIDGVACSVQTEADCAALLGLYQGDGTTCAGCPCPRYGACCLSDVECIYTTQLDCDLQEGDYVGDYTSCLDGPCVSGACCIGEQCVIVREHTCQADAGRFLGAGTTCDGDPCSFIISTPHVAGDFQGWNAGSHPMTEVPPNSGIWQITFGGLAPGSRHEFKVTNGTWQNSFPKRGNSWFFADANGEITITYDTNQYADGWAPSIARLPLSTDPGTWTAAGSFQTEIGAPGDWNNAEPLAAMLPQGGGIYRLEFSGVPAGQYFWKAVVTGSWDSVSWDERSVNTSDMEFIVGDPTDTVRLWVDALVGRVKVEVEAAPPAPCPGDFNCDGQINFDDIDPFVTSLVSQTCCDPSGANCDVNGDGNIDFDDIDPFVVLLSTGAQCP